MPAGQRVSQEVFDAAVQENIATFGQEVEEATADAVAEFELQGADLSQVVTKASSSRHPAQELSEALSRLVQRACSSGFSSDWQLVNGKVDELQACLLNGTSDEAARGASEAQKAGAVKPLLECLQRRSNSDYVGPSCRVLTAVLADPAAREDFVREQGVEAVCQLLASIGAEQLHLVLGLAGVLHAAATQHEQSKMAAVDQGVGSTCVQLLQHQALPADALVQMCSMLRIMCKADDTRPIASRAFQNGRTLGKQGVPSALMRQLRWRKASWAAPHASPGPDVKAPHASAVVSLQDPNKAERRTEEASQEGGERADAPEQDTDQAGSSPSQLCTALCSALKWLVVNEELCTEFAAEGGLPLITQVLESQMHSAAATRTAAALLRQLAGSDAIKAELIEAGIFDLITRATRAHLNQGHLAATEQLLGLLAALTLRNPSAGPLALEADCLSSALQALRKAMASNNARLAQWVARQACLALRNVAGRCPELREPVLEQGAEALLRSVHKCFAAACADVSSAALRDLECEDYQCRNA